MSKTYTTIAILALLGGLWGLHLWDKGVAVGKEKELVTARLNKLYQDKLDAVAVLTRKTQESLNTLHAKEEAEKNVKIKTLDTKLANALSELRKRPLRTTDSAISASSDKACTGAQLFREDGEFLTREAARADRVLIDRDYYYNEYENARNALEGLKH